MPGTVFDLIELRSFSSLWYWVLVALTWARITQSPLGVPYDLVERAAAAPQAGEDLLAMVGIQLRRRGQTQRRGQLLVGLWAFMITLLAGLAFWYGSELAYAVFLLAVPLALVQIMAARAVRDLRVIGPDLPQVTGRLRRLKRWTQALALISVFATAVIGMYHNLAHAFL